MSDTRGREPESVDERVVMLNYATLGVVDEILWLPSPSFAVAAVELLYGSEAGLPDPVLAQVGRGAPLSFASLLARPEPLAILLPSRLGPAAAWRAGADDLKEVRAIARRRYRELQAFFVTSPARTALESSDSLIQHTYGLRGRWLRSEAAKRLLDRVVALNRAALSLLAAISTGASRVSGGTFGAVSGRPFGVPLRALDSLGEALPPVAVPDFARLGESLIPAAPSLDGDESIERYQLLFAEMLSLAGRSEVRS